MPIWGSVGGPVDRERAGLPPFRVPTLPFSRHSPLYLSSSHRFIGPSVHLEFSILDLRLRQSEIGDIACRSSLATRHCLCDRAIGSSGHCGFSNAARPCFRPWTSSRHSSLFTRHCSPACASLWMTNSSVLRQEYRDKPLFFSDSPRKCDKSFVFNQPSRTLLLPFCFQQLIQSDLYL
jgi:hypothetical protein